MKKLTQTNEPDQKGLEPDENITIGGLEPAWPLGSDSVSQGDDHIRLLKLALQNTFSSFAEFETTNISPDELNFLKFAVVDESEDSDGTVIVIAGSAIGIVTRVAGLLEANGDINCDGDITAFYEAESGQSLEFSEGENIHTFLSAVSKAIDSSDQRTAELESKVSDLEATIRVLSGGA
ncbi:hypothetical protein VCRA2123O443_220027 [Vibrio crassostreae]|uniref:hypothetical protein n=1 Tax=Vibrio crassostreae TaxID=246167 RepID=UPI001B30D9D5|nr:hypothetical protein [Vibrio crassostreae]CAK1925908.1 hypothetical protein VCRA2110O182_220028 [Vibrio crassostreae]CAK2309537.1 hypothetical protein VCRA2111O408_220030 [Vibrio crassostreae]CAK2326232.1 hypothetical protein VCRA211O406_220026 [Vibrio crassostreae]CAK3239654.1 hypothetical protein VCRA2123O443_220027 [Vibrio crassostreae]